MLQSTIYADRSAIDAIAPPGRRDEGVFAITPVLGRLAALGRALLAGRTDTPLSDRLLDDIGLSRADIDALTL